MLINKTEKNNKGFSLIELLMVVGIGGALIAGALLLVSDVNTKKEIKQASENISTIYANMDSLFSGEAIDDDMDILVTAGVFPATLSINASGKPVTAGGGEVNIAKKGGGWELTYPKVRTSACVEILKNQKRVGWDTWAINKTGLGAVSFGSDRMDEATVSDFAGAAACGGATGDWVSLGFARNTL